MGINVEVRAGRLTRLWFGLFGLLVASIFHLQIVRGSYFRDLSERNRLRLVSLEGPRGKIEDRNGKILATSRLSFNCTAFLHEGPKRIRASFERLAAILGEDVTKLEQRYDRKRAGAFQSVLLAEDISLEQAVAIEEQLHLMPGILVETRPLRTYPYAESAAHVTGYIGPQSETETEELEFLGYNAADWVGREGLEKGYESYLRARSGGLQVEVDSRGQNPKVLGVKEPKEGRDIRLSIDAELQKFAYGELKGRRGSIIATDLRDGGLLCLTSSPSYDPNLFASARGRRQVGKYLNDKLSPLLNRAIQGQYPPGSIFKIVTALAALEPGKTKLSTSFNCPGFAVVGGKRFSCWREGGHGPQGLYDAFAHSCDVFFYKTGQAAGADAIHEKAVEMGFSAPTGIDLPGERAGLAPSRAWKKTRRRADWYDGDTMNYSIGQGFLMVTPLQALGMAAIIGADGQKLKPHLVEKIGGVTVAARHARAFVVTRQYLEAVQKGLDQVVNSNTGTGRLARIAGVRVAGKTGTAQTSKEADHAWFVGYAPQAKPVVAFVVFLEYGGHGGVEAAIVANAMLLKMKELGYFQETSP